MRARVPLLLALALAGAHAQDERRIASPSGEFEFRLRVAQPENGALFRLAYQVFFRGKPLVATSFLGLNIRDQEPLLGENVGLMAARTSQGKGYNSLVAQYMQNGSIGRRIDVEARAVDDGVAFRYLIPRSTPLEEILIEDEVTEFDLGPGVAGGDRMPLPFVTNRPGTGWVAITEWRTGNYPEAYLAQSEGSILITRLASRSGDPRVAFAGSTPLTCPWRVIAVAPDRESLMKANILRGLGQ